MNTEPDEGNSSRRKFLLAALGSTLSQPLTGGEQPAPPGGHNWADNVTYQAARLHEPRNIKQVQKLARTCRKLKALGSRHSFNRIADTTEDLVSLQHLNRVVAVDRERRTVRVEAGVKYGQLSRELHQQGFALGNLASLPHISVAGACATATHGSGDKNGNLATAVQALEVVTASGKVVVLSRERNPEHFDGMVVSLGGLGLVTRVTLAIVPTFDLRQYVYEGLPVTQLTENFDAIMGAGYSVSLFTDWRTSRINQVWVKRVAGNTLFTPLREWFGATLAPKDRHPIMSLSGESCTPQMGVRGPWYERLPHFKMNFTPSSGEELQSEYFVPRRHAIAAFRAIEELRERVTPVLQISEVRTIAADRLWMSTAYGRDSVAFHFTWRKDWDMVRKLLPVLEKALTPFGVRPHWGKLFTMSPAQVQACYEKLPDFQRLLREYDPDGKFRNEYLNRYIFGA